MLASVGRVQKTYGYIVGGILCLLLFTFGTYMLMQEYVELPKTTATITIIKHVMNDTLLTLQFIPKKIETFQSPAPAPAESPSPAPASESENNEVIERIMKIPKSMVYVVGQTIHIEYDPVTYAPAFPQLNPKYIGIGMLVLSVIMGIVIYIFNTSVSNKAVGTMYAVNKTIGLAGNVIKAI
jgi:hypothetical protein